MLAELCLSNSPQELQLLDDGDVKNSADSRNQRKAVSLVSLNGVTGSIALATTSIVQRSVTWLDTEQNAGAKRAKVAQHKLNEQEPPGKTPTEEKLNIAKVMKDTVPGAASNYVRLADVFGHRQTQGNGEGWEMVPFPPETPSATVYESLSRPQIRFGDQDRQGRRAQRTLGERRDVYYEP